MVVGARQHVQLGRFAARWEEVCGGVLFKEGGGQVVLLSISPAAGMFSFFYPSFLPAAGVFFLRRS
jgi:hypothetical protein